MIRREANGQRHDYSPCREMTPIPGRDPLLESAHYACAAVKQLLSQGIRPVSIDIPDNGVACAYIHVKYEDFISTLQADGDLLWEDGLERRKVTIKNIGNGPLLDKYRVQLSSNFGLWVLIATTPVRQVVDGAPELRPVRITGELPWDLRNWNPSKQPELWLQPLQEA